MSARQDMILIRIVDDDEGLREAIAFVLEGEGFKVQSFSSAESFLESDDPRVPGAVILDVKMTGMSGLKLQERLRACGNGIPLIFLSAHGTIDMAVDVMQKGAVTFLAKPVGTEKLLDALDRALAESPVFGNVPGDAAALSDREREVVRLVASGLTNRAIAERFGLSKRTIEFFRAGAMRKLGCRNAAALIERAKLLGISDER